MFVELRKLNLGAPAAERDDALDQYFLESEPYRRLLGGDRSVVLGNRGSGKSAVFRMIASEVRRRGDIVIELAPEDYSYELLQQSLAAEAQGSWAKQGAYSAAWKYLIYVAVMKEVVTGKGIKRGASGRIYNYLRDRHANFDTNPIGALISYLKRLEGVKIGPYEAGVKSRDLQSLYRLEEISSLVADLNEVCGRRRAVVLVDELDKGWDASEDAVAFVAGLFQSAVAINQRTPNIRVLLSLRKELYDNIPALYEDAQKVRDIIETITWDEPSLRAMIGLRLRHALGNPDVTPEAAWSTIFAEVLEYRKSKSFNYVIDRTLYRPRELIQFCNEAIQQAVENGNSAPLNYEVLSQAEHSYSEERVKDIAAEYRFQYPGLGSVFETFRGLPYNLDREQLELHCLGIATSEHKVDDDALFWINNLDPDRIIEILWRVGFVRARAVGGFKGRRRSGSEYLGSHQISNLNLLGISRFHVHPMFRSFLGLKEKKS